MFHTIESNVFFVSTDGNDSHSGTSPSQAWRTIQHAVDDADTPGDHVYIKKGDYGNETITGFTSGNSIDRITFEGYNSTPGDIIPDGIPTAAEAADMPELDHVDGTGYAFYVNNRDYITIKNFYITNYSSPIFFESSEYAIIDNIYGNDFGKIDSWNYGLLIKWSNNSVVNNSYMRDMCNGHLIHLWCSNNITLENCEARSDLVGNGPDDNTDYYFHLWHSSNNTIKNSIAYNEHAEEGGHRGHGFVIKDSSGDCPSSSYNQVINCTATDFQDAFSTQNGAHHNEFINCTQKSVASDGTYWGAFIQNSDHNVYKGCSFDRNYYVAVQFGSGSVNNTVENCVFTNGSTGVYKYGFGFIEYVTSAGNNVVKNSVFDTGVGSLIWLRESSSTNY